MITKKKILVLSDHALSTSGVGVQTRFLIEGLLKKYPGEWTFRQFGAAVKHDSYDTVAINEDFIIKPIDGFGNPDLIRMTLATERPDILLIFTDPRFFIWLWEMEDEIHQVCPIAYWHVWDNRPRPNFNDVLYASTDLINCHSYLSYEMVAEEFPEKTNFIPHTLPPGIFKSLPPSQVRSWKQKIIGAERRDHFTVFWVNRNAKRKRPGDLLWAWKLFLDKLEKKHGHKNATLILHTDPRDSEGPNMLAVGEMLGIVENIVFSTERLEFEQMNVLHNICDCCINISFAEGFGLSTLEAMQCGKPIIAVKTGGQTRQVVDHRDGSENGIALDVDYRSLVGSQSVPYIYEDYADVESIADGIYRMFEMGPEERQRLGRKAQKYVHEEFSHDKMIDSWHTALTELHETWKGNQTKWEHIEI